MKITLITVGKIKEKYLKDAIAEYSKRLSRYCKLEIAEVADEKTPDQAGETVEENIRNKEGERILKCIHDDMYVITLEINGVMLGIRRVCKEGRTARCTGKQQYRLCHRRIHWSWKRGTETRRLCTELL